MKTRKDCFESLAEQFPRAKGNKGKITEDVQYGLRTEKITRLFFEAWTGFSII